MHPASRPAPAAPHPLFYVLLALVTLLAYVGVLQNDFVVYDDPDYVTANHFVQRGLTWEGIRWAFTSTYYSNWFPLNWLSHMLDCQLFGVRPWAHHLMNVLYHAASTLLLFHVLRRMTGALWRSAFVAALFAWHPLRVESVAWACERKDTLSTLFWMLTLLAYLRYTEQPGLRRYATALVLFALGLMAKPMLVTLPFVLLLLDLWPLKRWQWPAVAVRKAEVPRVPDSSPEGRTPASPQSTLPSTLFRLVIEKLPFFALTLGSCIVTYFVQKHGHAVASTEYLTVPARLANVLVAYVGYILKMLWPVNSLAVFYPLQTSLPVWKPVLALLVLGGISAMAVRWVRSRTYALVGWFWYLGTLVPVVGFVQVGDQSMADRYSYIPTIGLAIILVWGANSLMIHWPALRLPLKILGGAVLAACVFLTGIQVTYWRNSKTLFGHAVKVTGPSHVALNVLGNQLVQEGQPAQARELFLQSILLRPNDPGARYCLGNAYAKEGKYDEAIAAYREVLRQAPGMPEPENALGVALLSKGQIDEAIPHFSEAARLDPNFLDPLYNRAVAYHKQGKLDEARASYLQVLQLKPDHKQALQNLGNLLIAQGKLTEAIPFLQRLLRVDPDSVDALNRLAWLFATHVDAGVRNGPQAVELATRACQLTGWRQAQSLNTLAAAYAEEGRFDDAVQTAQQALAIASASGQAPLAGIIQKLLQQYQGRMPYRDTPK